MKGRGKGQRQYKAVDSAFVAPASMHGISVKVHLIWCIQTCRPSVLDPAKKINLDLFKILCISGQRVLKAAGVGAARDWQCME